MSMTILADLHIHSRYSDGVLSIPEIVDLYGKLGFGAIAVTDHLCETNTFLGRTAHWLERTLTEENFPGYLAELKREAERAWQQYRMVLIPGVEITKNSLRHHKSAHVLGLGISSWVSAEGDIAESLKLLQNQGALTVAAHPVPTGLMEIQTCHLWNRREELHQSGLVDVWEVACGKQYFEIVASSGLPIVANSDLHHPRQMESYKMVLHCERSQEAVLSAIRQQSLDVIYWKVPKVSSIFESSALPQMPHLLYR